MTDVHHTPLVAFQLTRPGAHRDLRVILTSAVTRLVVAALLAASLVASTGPAAIPAAAVTATATPPADCQNAHLMTGSAKTTNSGGWAPVLLVHGITSTPEQFTQRQIGGGPSLSKAITVVPGTAVYGFDYSQNSLDWVTSPAIAPVLAGAITCLAAASGHQVIVVAHSMGGLATQQAQSTLGSNELAQVITLGTPTKGSVALAAANKVTVAGLVVNPPMTAFVAALLKLCGISGTATPHAGACSFLSSKDTAAGHAMTPGSAQLAALPPWKRGIVVARAAGKMNVDVELGPAHKTVDAGDGVVATSSALAGATGATYTDECNPPVTKVLSSECYHGNETANPAIVAWVIHQIAKTEKSPLTYKVPPTLGRVWGSYEKGYGTVRPTDIFNGGDPTGVMSGVTWDSWGGAQATGHGTAEYVAYGQIVADGTNEPAEVQAFQLGDCNGQYMYQAISWYFPQHGEKFDPETYINICTGQYFLQGVGLGDPGAADKITLKGVDPNTLTTDGIAPLQIGDPLGKAINLSGATSHPACPSRQSTLVEIVDPMAGAKLYFNNGVFTSYSVTGKGYATPSGGKVGMTADEITAKIPYAAREPAAYGDDSLTVHSGENVLHFYLDKTGTVTAIVGGKSNEAGYECE